MPKTEEENRNKGEIVLSHVQKKALFSVLMESLARAERIEIRGEGSEYLVAENDSLRKLMKDLVADLHVDVETFAPAESLLRLGFSDCFSDEKLNELANTRAVSDSDYERKKASEIREAANYFLKRRGLTFHH